MQKPLRQFLVFKSKILKMITAKVINKRLLAIAYTSVKNDKLEFCYFLLLMPSI